MPDEYAEPTEMERDVLGLTQQWLDDLDMEVHAAVVWEAGEHVIVTEAVRPQYGEMEFIVPPRRDASVDTWRAWFEAEYAPSFY